MFFGEPGPWFNKMQMDGDKTTVFHDIDGSVSEYPGAFLVKEDNWLLRHPDCIDVPDWRAAICSGHYAQVGQWASTSHVQYFLSHPVRHWLITCFVPIKVLRLLNEINHAHFDCLNKH